MPTAIDASKIRADLSRARSLIERGKARKEALIEEEAGLVATVAAAKGRLLIKDQIEKFLQIWQDEKLERTIGVYRTLLSAIVHDVIDPNTNIDLEMSTSYGQPALEVLAYKTEHPSERVNVYNSCGGAMINVVCAGLRAIAVARSGKRPLLVLDEPDCWIRPDRVPAFFNVLHGLCRDLKFQILVISHHPRPAYGNVHIIEAVSATTQVPIRDEAGEPTGQLKTEISLHATMPDTSDAWGSFEGKAFKEVRYKNFAAIGEATIHLVPGLNVICGDNNIGKSRILKAFRSAFYGGSDDSDIKLGKTSAMVEFIQNDGLTLQFTREKKRNPVNLWRLTQNDEVITLDNDRCEAGGRDVPDWVAKAFGISNEDEMELQLSNQLVPVFALHKPPSYQAALLSSGRETSDIRQMMVKHKENVTADNSTVRNGEKAIAALREKIAFAPDYEAIEKLIFNGDEILDQLIADETKVRDMRQLADAIEVSDRSLATLQSRQRTLAGLPNEAPVLRDCSPLINLKHEISTASARLVHLRREGSILQQLPVTVPALVDLTAYIEAINAIDSNSDHLDAIIRQKVILDLLPTEPPKLQEASSLLTAGNYIKATEKRLKELRRQEDILCQLPTTLPVLDVGRANILITEASAIRSRILQVGEVSNRLERITGDMNRVAQEVEMLREQVGDQCPICSNPIGDVLHRHNDQTVRLQAELVESQAPLLNQMVDHDEAAKQPPPTKETGPISRPIGFRSVRPLSALKPVNTPAAPRG